MLTYEYQTTKQCYLVTNENATITENNAKYFFNISIGFKDYTKYKSKALSPRHDPLKHETCEPNTWT